MSQPSKFDLMRANRERPRTRQERMESLMARIERIEAEEAAEWAAQHKAREWPPQGSPLRKPVPRWWWLVKQFRGTAAYQER
jgi:transposase